MEKGEDKVSNAVAAPSSGVEKHCLELLDGALHKCFVENKHSECFEDTNFEEVYLELVSNVKQETSESDGANVERALAFLKSVKGALLVTGASTMKCVVSRCYPSHIFHKKQLIGKSIKQFVHEANQHYFDVHDQPSMTKDCVGSNTPNVFECRFYVDNHVSPSDENCECETMKCIKFVERFSMDNLVKQDASGKLTAVGASYEDTKTSKYKCAPHMKDVVEKCLRCFMKPNLNGKSLKDVLLQQVLSQGKGSSRPHKIQLSNGTLANWLTKSELLPRSPQPREAQHIFSVHYIYKQGTLNGLNLHGLPESLHNIIPVPPEESTSTGSDVTETMTTTSIATTTSFSPDHFLSSTHYPNQPVKSETLMSESRPNYSQPPWQQRPARTSSEVTKDFLTGMPGSEQNFENMNGNMSPPPPHFDGPLVHAVGGHNQMIPSSSGTFQKSAVKQESSATAFVRPADGTGASFLSPNADTSMLNPGRFVGPPCVDLGACDLPSKIENLPPVSTTSVTSMFVNSITTSRMEANVTTTQCRMPSVNTAAVSSAGVSTLRNTPFSPTPRACATPDKTPTSCQHSPPKRPRSASINTAAAANSGSLKRTASTLSEDSGIGELANNCKISPIQRSKSKDKSKQKKTKILSELLTSKNTDEVSVAFSSNTSKNPLLAPTTSTNSTSAASSLSFNNVSPSISLSNLNPAKNQLQTGSHPVSTPPTSQLPARDPLSISQSSLSVDIPDEREIPDDIFSCYESIISSPSEDQASLLPRQSVAPPNQFQANTQTATRAGMNTQPPARQDSTLINSGPLPPVHPNPPDMMMSLPPQPQTMLPQPLPTPQVPTTQSLPTPPPFPSTTPPVNPLYRRIVPTGQETCPNRVIGSGGMLFPKTQAVPPVSQYRDFGAPENWDGQEPLVDLGSNPPPAGLNPRMAIPAHPQLNQPMMGNSNVVKLSPNPSNQSPGNRVSYPSSGLGMSAGTMQVNPSAQLQTPNNGSVVPSVSPRNFANTPSPTGYPQMRPTGNSNIVGPPYNMQPQRFAANGTIRARLLRQQGRPNAVPYRGDMPPRVPSQQFNYNNKTELSRFLPTQRANGAIIRPRKTSPQIQRAISSPGASNMYNQINPAPRFPTNQGSMNPYSPIQPQSHFSNPSSTFNNDVSSQMNFDPGMRSPGVMTPQNANQYPNNAYNNTMNNMGQVVGNNYPTEQINPGLPTSPMGKPQLKRSRSRKITRKKTGSVDESAWNEDASNGAYKQRPLMQMTIGNMHQRLQPTFNTSLDGALQSSTSMMSPQSGNVQTFNLNTLMNQNKNKMMDKVTIDANTPQASFQSPPNPNSLQPNPPAPNNWSGNYKPNDIAMTPSLVDDGMLGGKLKPRTLSLKPTKIGQLDRVMIYQLIFDGAMPQQNNPYPPLEGVATGDGNVTMNSNLNNNKFSDVHAQLRYTATATMLPDASSGLQQNKMEKLNKKQKNTKLLESLLLQNDE